MLLNSKQVNQQNRIVYLKLKIFYWEHLIKESNGKKSKWMYWSNTTMFYKSWCNAILQMRIQDSHKDGMCVCLYSSTVEASSICKTSETYSRGKMNDVVWWVSFQVFLLSSFISISKYVIFHLQRQNSRLPKTGKKTIWYKAPRKYDIYWYRI